MNSSGISNVRVLGAEELGAAAAALARGFHDDPLANYLIPDEHERVSALPVHFATVLRMGQLFGKVYTSGQPPLGAAVWFPPGSWELTEEQL